MDAVEIFVADEQTEVAIDTVRWSRLARMVLDAERDDKKLWGDCELSMIFIDETSMADLNERFLGREGPTDVLAFPLDDEIVESGRQPDQGGRGPGAPVEPGDAPVLIGDVVICPRVAQRQAPEHGTSLDDELALLVVHGVLHLLGFDHEDDDEAEAMEQREQDLLAQFRTFEGRDS